MDQIQTLLATIKRQLRLQGLNYRELGRALELSEPSVKRLFSTGTITLERLARIAELLGFTLAELAREAERAAPQVRTLTEDEEALLVSDIRLLLVAVCALNHWTLADIVETYALAEAECLQRLLQLDRLRLIELAPGNRIRLRITRDFDWLPEGPIRRFFREQGLDDFLAGPFAAEGEGLAFAHGMFTDSAFSELAAETARLRRRFAELHEASLAAPLERRQGASLLVASRRSWEPKAFAALRRQGRRA